MATFGPAEQIGSGNLALNTPSVGAAVGKVLAIASGSGDLWTLALVDPGAASVTEAAVLAALGFTPDHIVTASPPLVRTGNVLSIPAATGSVNGYLSSTDWTTFNSKQAALGYTAANDSAVVHIAGTETISGAKTFSDSVNLLTASNKGVTVESGAGAYFELRRTGQSHWRSAMVGNTYSIQNSWTGGTYNGVIGIEDAMGLGAGYTMLFSYNGGAKSVLIGSETPVGTAKLQVTGSIEAVGTSFIHVGSAVGGLEHWSGANRSGSRYFMTYPAGGLLGIANGMSYGMGSTDAASCDVRWSRVGANSSKFVGSDGVTLGAIAAASFDGSLAIANLTGLGTGWPAALAATYSAGGGSVPIITEIDGAPAVSATTIKFPNGSVTDLGGGVVSIAFGGGSGTVTASAGALTANSVVLGNGTTDTKVLAGITFDGTSKLNLGVSGTSVGGIVLANATSGTVTIQPAAGALGATVLSAPAGTDTLVTLAATQTLTSKTLTSPTLTAPALGTPASGILTNCTGTAAGLTAGTVTINANLSGDVTSAGNITTLTNAPVIAKVLTGYVSGAGTVAATDSILQAIQKLNGNDATNANLNGPIASSGNTTSITAQTGTGTTFVMQASPTLTTPVLGVATATSVNKVAITAPATGSTLTIAEGATLTASATASVSGTNTGDNAVNSLYSGLVSNANHSGDASGSTVLTLATVNANVGTFGSATQASSVTVNAKGLITACSAITVTPAIGSVTGLGTGVATALGIAVGSAGSPVTNGGALGTPSGGVATNLTGTAAGLTAGTVTTNANLSGAITSSGSNATSLGSFTKAQLDTAVSDGNVLYVGDVISLGSITGLGTGVATALAIAIGSAGAPFTNGGSGSYTVLTTTEVTSTPTGTTQTITLANGNHQTLTLTSATGTVAVTLTVPSSSAAGTIIVKQHASAAKGITWTPSAGTVKWAGAQPSWSSDATSAVRVVSWRFDGSTLYLASTDVFV